MTGIMQVFVAGVDKTDKTNWLTTLYTSSGSQGYSVNVDSSNNSYIVGNNFLDIEIASYETTGAVRWQKKLVTNSNGGAARGVVVDSSNNICVVGIYYVPASIIYRVIVAKFDSSGTIQWQRSLSATGEQYGYGIAVDPSNGIYVVGQHNQSGSTSGFLVAKYNSSGAIQWQRTLRSSTSGLRGGTAYKAVTDTGSSIYVVGYYDLNSLASSSYRNVQIAKYNASGVIQWQRSLSGSTNTSQEGYDITYEDIEQRIYITGYSNSFTDQSLIIAKYDLSGVIQWQRRLYSAGHFYYGLGITNYGSYIYVCGSGNPGGQNPRGLIVKYDTSGTIQWQRYFRASNTSRYVTLRSIQIDSTGNLVITGYTNETSGTINTIFTVRVPSDGTKTGTYVLGGFDFIYEASSLTDASTSLTDAVSSLTDSSISLTDAATSLTDSSSSLTINIAYMQ